MLNIDRHKKCTSRKVLSSVVSIMPKVTIYTLERIQSLFRQGLPPVAMFNELKTERSSASYVSVARIVRKIKLTGSIENYAREQRRPSLKQR